MIDTPVGDVMIDVTESVNFTGSGTDPEDDTPLSYYWSFSGGAPDSTLEDPGPVAFNTGGVFLVYLYAIDSRGLWDSTPDTVTVTVTDPFPNGGSVSGVIATTGQDLYEFPVTAGDHIELRIADTGGTAFTPRIRLRSPTEVLVATSADDAVAQIAHDATETGTFTVFVDDSVDVGGSYTLYSARIPGANEHGSLFSGSAFSETIDVGDLDTYTFNASFGNHIQLQVADVGSALLTPQLTLYAPSGAEIAVATDDDVARVEHDAVESGIFTVLVKDGTSIPKNSGAYNLYFANIPGGTEFGPLTSGVPQSETIDLGDIDTYAIFASAIGETISLELEKTSGTGSGLLELYDPTGTLVGSATTASPASLDHLVAQIGNYTVLVRDGGEPPTGSGDYILTYTTNLVITNGTIKLGVLPEGHLNVTNAGIPSLQAGTTSVGLRLIIPEGNETFPEGGESEATAPGCLCEGWGAAGDGISGYANFDAQGPPVNLNNVVFSSTAKHIRSLDCGHRNHAEGEARVRPERRYAVPLRGD